MTIRKKQPQPDSKKPQGQPSRPATKEDAMKQMVERDPRKAAEMLREILKNK